MSMDPPTKGKVVFRTSLGPVDIELFSKESPKTCRAFVQLCQEGYYNHQMVFARIIKNVLVETGSSIGADKTEDGLPFASENHGRLRFTVRGRVACVAPNGASSDFFITLDKSEWLNGKHTIFGKVVGDSLFNVVRIGELDTDKHDKPYDAPEILGVDVVDNPFDDIVCRVLSKRIVPPLASDRSGHSLLQKKIINREGVVKKAPVLSFGGIHKLEDGDGEDGGGGGGVQNSSRLMKRSLSEATAAELSLKKRSRLDGAGNVHQEDEEEVEGEDGRRGGGRSKMDDQSETVNSLKGFSSIPVSAQDAAAAAAARRKEEYARLKRELKAAKEKGIPSNGSSITSATAASSSSSSQLSRDVTASSDEKRDSTINSSSSSKSSGLSILQQMRGKYAAAKEKASGHSNSGHSTTSARDASTLEKLAAFTSKLKTTTAFGFDSLSTSSSSSSSSNNDQGGGLKFVRHIDDESRGLYLGVGAGMAEYSPSRSEAAATRAGYGAHNAKNESIAIKRAVDENISTEDLADAIMREIQDEMKM